MGEVRRSLGHALVWAVATEFLLVRLLSRVGVYIPKSGAALSLYEAAVLLGEVAFNLSFGLAVLLLVLAVWRDRTLAPALLLLLGLPFGPVAAIASLLATVLLLGGAALYRGGIPERVGFGLLLLAQTMHGLGVGLQRLWSEGAFPGEMPGAAWLLQGAELAALLGPIALLTESLTRGQWKGLPRWWLGSAAAASLGLAAAFWTQPDLTGVLAMFSLGFSLSWPALLYVLAAGAALLTVGKAQGEARVGLILLLLAGLSLNVNQQQVVVMAAWALLAQRPAESMEVRLRDAV